MKINQQQSNWILDALLFAGFIISFAMGLDGALLASVDRRLRRTARYLPSHSPLGLGDLCDRTPLRKDLCSGENLLPPRCGDHDRLLFDWADWNYHFHLAQPDADELRCLGGFSCDHINPDLDPDRAKDRLALALDRACGASVHVHPGTSTCTSRENHHCIETGYGLCSGFRCDDPARLSKTDGDRWDRLVGSRLLHLE